MRIEQSVVIMIKFLYKLGVGEDFWLYKLNDEAYFRIKKR